jgi:hypothetical protein
MAQEPMLRAEVGMHVRCANKALASVSFGFVLVRVRVQTKQVRNDSGGRGALAKFLEKFAKSEEFVGVAHSAEQ